MTRLILAISMVLVATSSSLQAKQPIVCPGYDNSSSRGEIDHYFAKRSVEILQSGLAGDVKHLGTLVDPKAKFLIWHGDEGRGRKQGIDGAMEMARSLKPTSYQFATGFDGPFSVSLDSCSWEIEGLLRVEGDLPGVVIKFKFTDGMLVSASGRYVNLIEGAFR